MRLLYFSFCSLFLSASCTEKGPIIDFGNTVKEDTTYIASPETPQLHNVLVEEFTGVSCPPCPAGHEQMKGLKTQHGERLIIIAHHILNFPQAEPIKNLSKQDFRTEDATVIGNTVFGGVSAMPVAGVDRVPANNEDLLLSRGNWAAAVNGRMTQVAPINLHLTSVFNETSREVTLKIKIAFTQDVFKKQSLTVGIIEDGIIDAQKNQLKIDTVYTHNYVLRDIITNTNGLAVLDDINPKTKGRVYERVLKFSTSEKWNADQCKIVAFISNSEGADKEVQQVALVKLKL